MLSLNNRKRCISIGIILITILNISSPTNIYSTNRIKIQLQRSENYSHTPSPRTLCLILTSPKYFPTRTKAVHETWGPRGDRHFFITEYPENDMTSDQFNIKNQISISPVKNITLGYDHLTQKSKLAFLFAYENYFNNFD